MKTALLFFLTISLSSPVFANNAPREAVVAPSSDNSITGQKTGQEEYHDYDNTDNIRTGQSSTARSTGKACKASDGTWLHSGDMGYTGCVKDKNRMKK